MAELGVGNGGGVQHRDAIEARAGAHRVDDRPHGRPDLLVGIGRGEDRGAARRDRPCGGAVEGRRDVQAGEGLVDLRVGVLLAREADDDRGRQVLRERLEEAGGVQREALGEVHHQRPELLAHPAGVGEGGSLEQVLLVGPRRGEAGPDGPVEADHLGGAGRRAGQRIECGRRAVAQLPVGGHERGLGGGVLPDGLEEPGVGGQLGPHRRGQHRGGHRPLALGGKGARAEQLRQAERGEERDGGDPDPGPRDRPELPGGEQPAGGHADVVGRHDDRDELERVARLGGHDGGEDGLAGAEPGAARRRGDHATQARSRL